MEFGTAVGGFIGSPLLAGLGGRGLYFAFGTVVLAIVAITALIQKRLPSEQELLASAVRQERQSYVGYSCWLAILPSDAILQPA